VRSSVTIISMMILVGTEVFAVAIASGWAIAGLLELGDSVGHVLMVLFSAVAAWTMFQLWKRATAAEPLRGSTAARETRS